MKKIIALIVSVMFCLSLSSCVTGQIQASAACVKALADIGVSIAEGSLGGTFDLSSVLAVILANGGDISAAVSACSAVFMARTSTDLDKVVKAKAGELKSATRPPSATAQKIPVPAPAVKVRIR